MKNYVIRFANDMISEYWKYSKSNPDLAASAISQISRIVAHCENGAITDFEAVSAIVDICKEKD